MSSRMLQKSLALMVTFLAVGCVSKANEVRTRATFDLGCAADKLDVKPLTSEAMETATYGVQGCSKKATYVYRPGDGAVLNSPIQAADK
jgi:hypothetical protein